jgi:hypothetical protein
MFTKKSNYRPKRTFVEWFILICFVMVIGGAVLTVGGRFLGFGQGIAYSEGTRSGVVYKFSKKGFVYHTWEGELSLGLNERDGEGNIIPAIFNFSCSNEAIANEIINAEKSGKRVTLHYKQYFFRGYSYGETDYDIIKVEKSDEKEQSFLREKNGNEILDGIHELILQNSGWVRRFT